MTKLARKLILPQLLLTELAEEGDKAGIRVEVVSQDHTQNATYYVQPKLIASDSNWRSGKPKQEYSQFSLYPVILSRDGAPWPEANIWILSTLEGKVQPNMSSFASIAEDLTAYLRFIEEYSIDWLTFPSQKLGRPTYRFNGHLKHLIHSQEISPSTAKRRMSAVIRFYKWLIEEGVLAPQYPPWKSGERYVEFKGHYGESAVKKITTTDVSIRVAIQDDPYDECIDDGGKLRPLPQNEQEWLMDALISLGNTEMILIHLFGFVTGARIQTILTFRIRDVLKENGASLQGFLRYPIGPGTGIDTKYDKKMVLHIPIWFYEMLHTYAKSDRARTRRLRADGGDSENQYLFLSIRGAPFYAAKQSPSLNTSNMLRHSKVGQGVRQYIKDYIIPFIKNKYDPRFHYRFHDIRATFGMNLVDDRLRLIEEKKTTLKEVMAFVQTRMGHASLTTTERYVTYRSRLNLVHAVQDGWEAKLEQMAKQAMERTDG